MTLLALTFLAAAPFSPAPTDYVSLHPATRSPEDLRASGPVAIFARDGGAGAPPEFGFSVDGGAEVRLVLPRGVAPPFASGDQVEVTLTRTGGWHVLYTGAVTSRDGALLLAVSHGGRSPLPEGWEVEQGPLERTESRPDSTTRHFFTLIRAGESEAAVKVPSRGWITFEAKGARYLAWAAAESRKWVKDSAPDDAVGDIHDWALVKLGPASVTDAGSAGAVDAGAPTTGQKAPKSKR